MNHSIRQGSSLRTRGGRVARIGLTAGFVLAAAATAGTVAAETPSLSSATLGPSQTGDSDGTGSIDLTFDATGDRICSTLTVADIEAPTMAHIHRGVAGSTGPVVVPLSINLGTTECVTADDALLDEILGAPADFYVNVHNDEFPAGAVRGQVSGFVASEVNVGSSFDLLPTGDVDGSGTTSLLFGPGEICFAVTATTDEEITVGHIHEGVANMNGPIVVEFDLPTNGLDDCVPVDQAIIDSILADPAGFYVNIHTTESPGGAIRNQIADTDEVQDSTTPLDGLGFGDPDGSGDVTFSFYENGDVCFTLTTADIDDATMGHIHAGADGVQGPVLVDLEFTGTSDTDCVSGTEANVAAIVAAPGDHYINVHNDAFPLGAIRGQLNEITDGAETFEFNDIVLVATGDPDGSGTASLDIDADTGRVCFVITTADIGDVTVAHIHSGGADETGDVVVDFNPAANGLEGCVVAEPSVAAEIVANPADFYINIHTEEASGGAIRAQVNGDAPDVDDSDGDTTTTTVAPTTAAPTTAATPTTDLPATGNSSASLAWMALALIAGGALIVASTRRRGPIS